jgi:PilZ domain
MKGPRPEDRHSVDFPVFLSWQAANGMIQRVSGRCLDLSASGARVETRDRMEQRAHVLMHSEAFGRMGTATVRYCRREGMKYIIGLQFGAVFGLSDPVRRKTLERVLREKIPTEAPPGHEL